MCFAVQFVVITGCTVFCIAIRYRQNESMAMLVMVLQNAVLL